MEDPNQVTEEESHSRQKKARAQLGFSLAFRVLFISFIFIILPLIIYTILVYSWDYHRKLNSVFEEMRLFQEDQITMVHDVEKNAENFLVTFVMLMTGLQHEGKKLSDFELEPILLSYSQRSDLTAISLIEHTRDGKLICSKSTLPIYQNENFTDIFPKDILSKKGAQVFFAKDPVFGHSLYISYRIPDFLDNKEAMAVVSISGEELVELLNKRKKIFQMNLGIVDSDFHVVSSTDPELFGMKLVFDHTKAKGGKHELYMQTTRTVKNGYKYYLDKKKRFCVLERVPNSSAYLFTSVPSEVLLAKMTEQIIELLILLGCVLVVGGIAAFLFTHRIAKPLKELGGVMSKVGEGKLEERYHRDRMGFEMNFLGERFNQMVESLINYIEEVKKERASKEALAKELQIGHEIQQSILPQKELDFPGIDVAVYFKPAKEVAGDFFDWLIKEGEILITVADGVGKGVSSALYSFDLRSILRSFATTHQDLNDVVMKTNELFCHDTKESGNFVTAFLALYKSQEKKLEYVNCGHNYPYVRKKNGEVIRLETKGIAFGVDEITEVDVQSVHLESGDYFIMFTDGITDAQNKQQELYTERRLEEVIKSSQHDYSEALLNEIISQVDTFTGGADQYDDMTLIVLKIKES